MINETIINFISGSIKTDPILAGYISSGSLDVSTWDYNLSNNLNDEVSKIKLLASVKFDDSIFNSTKFESRNISEFIFNGKVLIIENPRINRKLPVYLTQFDATEHIFGKLNNLSTARSVISNFNKISVQEVKNIENNNDLLQCEIKFQTKGILEND